MRTTKTCLLSVLLALFALPAFADDALIAELIRLDETRRAETKTLHVEYDVATQIGDAISFEAPGNVWEQHGENKYRFSCRSQAPSEDPRRKGERLDLMVEGSFDGSDRHVLKVPREAYPVEGAIDPSCYYDERYGGAIERNASKILDDAYNPFLPLYVVVFPLNKPSVFPSYKGIFESNAPKRVEKFQNEDGDEIVQVEFEAKEARSSLWKEWALTIDFNLSKGGLISKYSHTWASESAAGRVGKIETSVIRFEESQPGKWYPQTLQVACDEGDPAKNTVTTTSISKFSVNDESALQLSDARFPRGLIVQETDAATDNIKYHVWGDDKPKRTFTQPSDVYDYLDNAIRFRFLAPILGAALVVAVLLAAIAVLLKAETKENDSV
jgi:hypothetical protein